MKTLLKIETFKILAPELNIISSMCFEWFSVCLENFLYHTWSLSQK